MNVDKNIGQKYYQIFFSYSYKDSNTTNHFFWFLKKFEKESKLKFILNKLSSSQKWLEFILNIIRESKYFNLLISKKITENDLLIEEKYIQNEKMITKLLAKGRIQI